MQVGVTMLLSVPFWICWTYYGLGAMYFDFLPAKYHAIPFLHCVGLFIVVVSLKEMLTPRFASVYNECEVTNKGSKVYMGEKEGEKVK